MGCSTSGPERAGAAGARALVPLVLVPIALVGLWAGTAPTRADEGESKWDVEARLSVGAGYQSEAVVDPERDPTLASGGAFLGVSPVLFATRPLGSGDLSFSAEGSAERLDNDDRRTFAALSGRGDLTLRGRGAVFGRLSVGVGMFEDSVLDTARRRDASLRAALGWGTSRRIVELFAFGRDRRYPDLIAPDDTGLSGEYDETTTGIGVTGSAVAGGRVLLRAEVVRDRTDARDPAFDSRAWYARGDLAYVGGTRWRTSLSAVLQRREYDLRDTEPDEADYFQAGLRLDRNPGRRRGFSLQYAYVTYDDAGGSEDGHRLGAFAIFRFGSKPSPPAVLPSPPENEPAGTQAAVLRSGSVRFRLHAPGARDVFVAGDFNGWDPGANPLQPSGEGWWETVIPIPPGIHQYAFVVDGAWLPPPPPAVVVDDGFGGRNGLLEVPASRP